MRNLLLNLKNLGYLITMEETQMLEFTKENLDLIAGTRPPMTEFIILKDLHNGKLVLDNYIVTELPYIGCMSFIVHDMIEMGTDKFFDYVNRIIPRSLMSYSNISEICGNKFTHKLYSDEKYKPIVIKEGRTEYLLFDKDVLLEYCSEHFDELSKRGKLFFTARKDTYKHDKLVVFDLDEAIKTDKNKCVSVDGCLEIPFE